MFMRQPAVEFSRGKWVTDIDRKGVIHLVVVTCGDAGPQMLDGSQIVVPADAGAWLQVHCSGFFESAPWRLNAHVAVNQSGETGRRGPSFGLQAWYCHKRGFQPIAQFVIQ